MMQKRRRRRRRAVYVRRAAAVVLLGAVGWGLWTLWNSPIFKVTTIEVAGLSRLSEREVVRASGVRLGSNILGISTSEVATRVRRVAWVQSAKVERSVPGKIRLIVVERMPVFALITSTGNILLDGAGVVLQRGDLAKPAGGSAGDPPTDSKLIELTEVPETKAEPGRVLPSRAVRDVLIILKLLPDDVYDRIGRVRAPSADGIAFSLTEGPEVSYGAAERMRRKNQILKMLLARYEADTRKAISIDVRAPDHPSAREAPR